MEEKEKLSSSIPTEKLTEKIVSEPGFIQLDNLKIEFNTAIEALEKCLHIPGFTNEIFKEIIKQRALSPQQFTDWVEMQLNIYFGSKVTMGGKVAKIEKDNDILWIMHYFCETIEYNPEKVFLMLNRHNTEIIRDITDKVGIGTIMLFHSLMGKVDKI